MKRLVFLLLLAAGAWAQDLPSVLAVSRADAKQALEETGRDLATEGAKAIVKSHQKGLQDLASMSNTQGKKVFGVEGAGKRAQVGVLKDEAAKKASWVRKWRLVAGVLEVGDAIGEAGGYVVEGDARGAFGVVAETAGKKLSGWAGGAAGTLVAGPLGAVAGAAAGEGTWGLNPVRRWIRSFVDEGRDRAAQDQMLGYRPAWRDPEAVKAWKQREAEKAKQAAGVPAAGPPGEDAEALRRQVEGRLISQNLPAPEALVKQLVGLIQSRGIDALESALKECAAMQGTFEGTLNGRGSLRVVVEGLAVSASFADHSEASAGGVRASATTTGAFSGTFDPVSGNLVFEGTVKVVAVAKGIKPTPDLFPTRFTGHFTGQGFKGNATANGQSLPWSVGR